MSEFQKINFTGRKFLCASAPLREVFLVLIIFSAPAFAQTNAVFSAPEIATNLPLRKLGMTADFAPKLAETPPPESPQLRLSPLAPAPSLADAQAAVLRAPESWRNWAALAKARYAAGDFDKAFAAVKQMRAVAAARNEPLPLAADELFAKCKRANDALSLLE